MTSILWAPRSAGRTANASRTLGGHHYTIGRARYLSRSVVRRPVAAVNAGRRAASRCVMNAGNRPASLRHLDHNCSENGNLAVSMPSPGGRSARRIRISMIAADSHTIVSVPPPLQALRPKQNLPVRNRALVSDGQFFLFRQGNTAQWILRKLCRAFPSIHSSSPRRSSWGRLSKRSPGCPGRNICPWGTPFS